MQLSQQHKKYVQRIVTLHLTYRVTVAKRLLPCCGRGAERTGGVFLKPTVVLLRSPGDEIQPLHSRGDSRHLKKGSRDLKLQEDVQARREVY